jgi:hypothetical protein
LQSVLSSCKIDGIQSEEQMKTARCCAILVLIMLAAACGSPGENIVDETRSKDESSAPADNSEQSEISDIVEPEIETDLGVMPDNLDQVDFGETEDLLSQPGQPGSSCVSGDDCFSGYCVHTPTGKQCTITCLEECPFDWECAQHKASLPDEVYICAPTGLSLCRPCLKNSDCLANGIELGDLCVPYGADGSFCGSHCLDSSDCPADYTCEEVLDVWGYEGTQCKKTEGQCNCQPWFADEEAVTVCTSNNQYGTCEGTRHCGPEGLSDCDAPAPASEVCNGDDDDCDGDIDEGTGGSKCYVENDWGACPGTWFCEAGELLCDADEPQPEICDGKDNDCNGVVDDGFPDSDNDGITDCLENDKDGDGVVDLLDNCPGVANPDQLDNDLDMAGNACDPDDDNDQSADWQDCAPLNKVIFPGAQEVCNGLDDDCDNLVDEGFADSDSDALSDCIDTDDDNDGSVDTDDCGPTDPLTHPGADEKCDGVDNNCDGLKDENFPDQDDDGIADCVDGDLDGDGHSNGIDNCPVLANPTQADADGDGTGDMCDPDLDGDGIPNAVDTCPVLFNPGQHDLDKDGFGDLCDDDKDGDSVLDAVDNCSLVANPGQEDLDNDSTGDACDGDSDGDGVADDEDCQPTDPYVFPGGIEDCDGSDNNCNGIVDEGFPDSDFDGFKNCVDPDDDDDGYKDTADCEPLDPKVNPGIQEICNGIDDNCSGKTDENTGEQVCGKGECFHSQQACLNGKLQTCDLWLGIAPEVCDGKDNDCDGLTDEDQGTTTCGQGQCLHVQVNCDGGQAVVCNPFAGASPEVCDGKDNDCNGAIDELNADGCVLLFADLDKDGHGAGDPLCFCQATGVYSALNSDDCVDSDPWVYPGATEFCDNKDNNCDEVVDEAGATGCSWFFVDDDGDGYGSGDPSCVCTAPGLGYSVLAGDCDEALSEVHPGALELCDEQDNDCDGEVDESFDLDTDPLNCGVCSYLCQPDNALGECVEGKCAVLECVEGYLDCDDKPVTGCEVHADQDEENCGDCGTICALDHASEVCLDGICSIAECDEYYGDANNKPEDGCEAFTVGSQDEPVFSCKELSGLVPSAPSGNYWILAGGAVALQVYCDMDEHGGGWTRIGRSDGSTIINGTHYTNGSGSFGDANYQIQCDKLAGLGLTTVTVRVNMGEVRDFFRPRANADMCQMLSESPGTHHLWSDAPSIGFIQPEYYSSHLGGSKSGWPPKDNRTYVSFWGGQGSPAGGCCALDLQTANGSWERAFEMYVRESD